MSRARRLLALAVATAVIGGGGVAFAQANGSSKSQAPAKAHVAKKPQRTQQSRTAPHTCPDHGSNSGTSNTASDL